MYGSILYPPFANTEYAWAISNGDADPAPSANPPFFGKSSSLNPNFLIWFTAYSIPILSISNLTVAKFMDRTKASLRRCSP